MLKYLIWGTGSTWKDIKEYIDYDEIDIVGFVDNNPKWKEIHMGGIKIPVFLPDQCFNNEKIVFEKIFVASIYYKEIQRQLLEEYKIGQEYIELYWNPNKSTVKASYFKEMLKEKAYAEKLENISRKICTEMHLQAKILNAVNSKREIRSIRDAEFKVYSQWGEDGIIQYLIHKIPVKNRTFIEFGVENYQESNTRFLLEENNWSGMIIDGSSENMESVKREELYWRYDLQAVDAFITKDNINDLLKQSGFDSDLGLLSIDIDGNDYWVLKEINVMKPRILICEYNAIYGGKEAVTVCYKKDFYRTDEHYSNLHFGASLEAIKRAAREKGYHFIGVNSNACNAFFVRDDLICYLPDSMVNDSLFVPYKYRQARNRDGQLTFLDHRKEMELISNEELYDITNQRVIKVRELCL